MIRSLMFGDLYKNWETLLRVTRVTDENEGKDEKKKSAYFANSLIALFMCYSVFRLFFTGFLDTSAPHLWGNILTHTGNTRHLLGASAASIFIECVFYRIGVMRLVQRDSMYVLRSLRAIASCTKEIREKKERLARIILVTAVIGMINMSVNNGALVTGIAFVNIKNSTDDWQIACWCFWLIVDFVTIRFFTVDLFIFPCIWILGALNYRTDLMSLVERIDDMKNQSNAIASTAIFREVYLTYFRLKAKADLTNRMSAPILWALTFCTIPIVCINTFISVYSDNIMFRLGNPVIGLLIGLFAGSLLLVAADITTLAEQVHTGLCCTSARNQKKWTLKHRLMMLNLVQDAASADPPLAMYTINGDKYTSESLMLYTIDTALNYLLLVNLKNSILA